MNNKLHLENFKPHEFGPSPYREENWWPRMDPRLLVLLDLLRYLWGAPIRISNNAEALGRHLGDSGSMHNVEIHGLVKAIDVFPDKVIDRESARAIVKLAKACGFTGIGIYPQWSGGFGLHLDVREDRMMGDPALWGALKDENFGQVYVSMEAALLAMSGKTTDTLDKAGQAETKSD